MQLTLTQSQAIVTAAIEKAGSLGANVSAAVVDSGGNLTAFARADGAEIAGPILAVDKAYTSVSNRIATHELATLAVPGGPLFGIHANGGGRFVIFGGGIPLEDSAGTVIGAIGVSGGAVEEDIASAEAGVAEWRRIRGSNAA
jgi:uncharacterized protein GlcG (DUF336 family)